MAQVSLAKSERAALCDLFEEVGPDAPTLCEGWTTLDLAAHLVVRERRPDSGPGLLIPAFSSWTEGLRRSAKERGFPRLIEQVRNGPPKYSPMALLDETVNGMEYFVHHEDVRRARPDWEPRELSPDIQKMLWKRVVGGARLGVRKSPVGIVLEQPDGTSAVVKRTEPSVTVVGPPEEIAMFTSGRKTASRVEFRGDEKAIDDLRAAKLGV
jgi:uncharacterized protein (TIGR03085 family)